MCSSAYPCEPRDARCWGSQGARRGKMPRLVRRSGRRGAENRREPGRGPRRHGGCSRAGARAGMDVVTARTGALGDTQVMTVAPAARRPVVILAATLAIVIAVCVAWGVQGAVLRAAGRSLAVTANVRAPFKAMTLTLQRAAVDSGYMLPVYG